MLHMDAILAAVRAAPIFLALFGLAGTAGAASVQVTVRDSHGAPVANAAVWAQPKVAPAQMPKREASIEQKDKTFIPMVTVIQVGTAVSFPNRDEIRHHVYSFSAAKTFELKLYAGTPAAPVLFDKPGEVILGCNIHDTMLAFVYVVETPWFGKTNAEGVAVMDNVPAGDYEINMRHFAQASPQAAQPMTLRGDEKASAAFEVTLKALPPRPAAK
jgi:plastocyanin